MSITHENAVNAIYQVQDPVTLRPIGQLDLVSEVTIDGNRVHVVIDSLAFGAKTQHAMQQGIIASLTAIGARQVDFTWGVKVRGRDIGQGDPLARVANVIAIMSGKGGVGKSTIAANLALGFAQMQAKVGLLDADMYGPSVPTMFGVSEPPTSNDGHKIQPIERWGVALMSIGFLLENPRDAIVWRGPMLHSALLQFFNDVNWGELDYLLLDLPPGTGDIPLTLSQKLQLTGAVIVTTPQEVALQDVYKSVSMCQKVNIPILGVVENESYFLCDQCSKRHEIFGNGGGQKVADMAKAPLLAQIPIDCGCRQAGDAGTPVVQLAPTSPAAISLKDCAENLSVAVAQYHARRPSTTIHIDRKGGQNRRLPVIK